ncbi:hypothetical protein PAXRUDRAFT_412985 [Paxillus rubicundulus Ve08.2h10]|uniref:Secreted protein n=1 Tax=Paxillus rubicundulus Ve08.2h10 TaxID=930991 RepID=A0A0D0DXY0_9AGAM|nr:hypothetical protein PAXRUDRAFT_412985 [Paxillus rubicundulus Ve08.2h10]
MSVSHWCGLGITTSLLVCSRVFLQPFSVQGLRLKLEVTCRTADPLEPASDVRFPMYNGVRQARRVSCGNIDRSSVLPHIDQGPLPLSESLSTRRKSNHMQRANMQEDR